ncbi:MAG: ThuA domain-containing protein [Prevotella sp.]|nr:ThuA domain-containing protein [Prevotella sp.]
MKNGSSPYPADYAGNRVRFRTLVIWDPSAEPAHVDFDQQAIHFIHKLSYGDGFTFDTRTTFPVSVDTLRQYDVVVMLNALPQDAAARKAFEQYMEQGGGWMGFHGTGYNDADTHWPWFNKFLGCGTFLCNNWPPQPALVDVESEQHPVTRTLPRQFVAPASEFYQFSPSPRANEDVEVLVSISPKMYSFGIKDIVTYGDFPIVWTNKKYRMIYLNMGHGDECFIDANQNLLFTNAFRWVVSRCF